MTREAVFGLHCDTCGCMTELREAGEIISKTPAMAQVFPGVPSAAPHDRQRGPSPLFQVLPPGRLPPPPRCPPSIS
ncbi:hypothetical protein E2C01_044425 [Portunus trituberculatus]|uniref:Uncharacterized protein n=1 Tax=Portunus trituberculatus TaxID=210409 RepID=A0A5B7FYF3_PORTR|nr:hypothetical protein [Portunus trituberculatus]